MTLVNHEMFKAHKDVKCPLQHLSFPFDCRGAVIVIDEAAPRREEPQGLGELDEHLQHNPSLAASVISPSAGASGAKPLMSFHMPHTPLQGCMAAVEYSVSLISACSELSAGNESKGDAQLQTSFSHLLFK